MIKESKSDSVMLAYYTSKSNALKVIANSIYGETGYVFSPLYELLVSSSVTAYARELLKRVVSYLESLDCKVIYGDTDSVFYTIPADNFTEFDNEFLMQKNKKIYWSKKIEKTIEYSYMLEKKVNEYMKQLTGLSYMKMAYEKTLHPSIFFHKKQYCGCEHENKSNLDNPKLYLKGLKIVKRNTSLFYKTIAKEMIWSVLGFDNDKQISEKTPNPKQIVIDIITRNIQQVQELDIELFKLTGKYNSSDDRTTIKDYMKKQDIKNKKPILSKKGNTMILDFKERMNNMGINIIVGRVYYIVLKHLNSKDPKVNISQKMIEYSHFDPENKDHKLDIVYYFNSLIDLCVGLMKTDEKVVKKMIEDLDKKYNEEGLTDCKRKKDNKYEILTVKRKKLKQDSSLIELTQRKIDSYFKK
jgi:DNA polymerase elongation subunit (family B)